MCGCPLAWRNCWYCKPVCFPLLILRKKSTGIEPVCVCVCVCVVVCVNVMAWCVPGTATVFLSWLFHTWKHTHTHTWTGSRPNHSYLLHPDSSPVEMESMRAFCLSADFCLSVNQNSVDTDLWGCCCLWARALQSCRTGSAVTEVMAQAYTTRGSIGTVAHWDTQITVHNWLFLNSEIDDTINMQESNVVDLWLEGCLLKSSD